MDFSFDISGIFLFFLLWSVQRYGFATENRTNRARGEVDRNIRIGVGRKESGKCTTGFSVYDVLHCLILLNPLIDVLVLSMHQSFAFFHCLV